MSDVVRCKDCKYYVSKYRRCINERNENRGSGGEYLFDMEYVGMDVPLLSQEECDNWFCGDAKRRIETE